MTPLDAREFLDSLRMQGNEFADELLEAFDIMDSGEYDNMRNAFDDLRKLCPSEPVDPWRIVEWLIDQLDQLNSIRDILGNPSGDLDDRVRDLFDTLGCAEECLQDRGHWPEGEFLDALARLAENEPKPYNL